MSEPKITLRSALAVTLRAARKMRRLTQEDFSDVSSRTYLSSLERGLKSPTIDKLSELAQVMGVHPASLLLAAYAILEGKTETKTTIDQVLSESTTLIKNL